jgi:formylglycine-generating enzyme required for sulfatase activity
VQIKKALQQYPDKRLMCIKSGDFNLADFNYIMELEDYWSDQKKEYEKIEYHRLREHSGTEKAAWQNGFYLEHIRKLYSFFSAINYSNSASINYESFVGDIVKYYQATPKPVLTPKPQKSNPQPQTRTDNPQTRAANPPTYTAQSSNYTRTAPPTKLSSTSEKQSTKWPLIAAAAVILVGLVYVIMPSTENSADVTQTDNQPTQQLIQQPPANDEHDLDFTVSGVTFKMKYVPGGTFQMGATSEQGSDADDDERVHTVTISNDYYIGETEVTQGLWKAVMGSNPSHFDKGDNYPVESVSWDDCRVFINKLNQQTGQNFRLPTEAEWEYAARGGKSGGTKYSGSNIIGDVAVYVENSRKETHPVKSKSPNELGLYDMSGNVNEWCQDWYGDYPSGSVTDPVGPSSSPESSRILRGGSWNCDATYCRVSNHGYDTPSSRGSYGGLRLALVP